MKDFSRSRYDFTRVSINQKIVYSLFLLFVLFGYGSIVLFFSTKTGWTPGALVRYYRGDEAAMIYPKSFGELWEITHFHLFSVPILFLVLAHLFMMTHWRPRDKALVLVGAFVAIVADLVSPWLIRYLAPGFAILKVVARGVTLATTAVFIGAPLDEMWLKPRRRRL